MGGVSEGGFSEGGDPVRTVALRSCLTGAVVLVILLGTSSHLPITWDEGNGIFRASGLATWMEKVSNGELSILDRQGIEDHWLYTTRIEGHPALYGVVIAAGMTVPSSLLAPLDACRFGPMALFAIAAAAMFYRLHRQYDLTTALAAVAAMLLLPRLFAHAHLASFDSPLVSCWILAWACFAPARDHWGSAVLWGMTLGMTMSCKLTGWGAPVPFVIWAAIYRDRAAAKAIIVAGVVAALTFFLLNPPLWHAPWEGLSSFFKLNFRREFNVPTQFLGATYDLDRPLPLYNTVVWLAVTVPLGLLVFALVGAYSALRDWNRDPMGILVLGQWLALLVVRALPLAPPHDAVRLILPSFAFCAVVIALGVRKVLSCQGVARKWCAVAVTAVYLGSASNLMFYQPQWLSYYSLTIGGLPGAVAAGMEPTYYWDGLDQDVLTWLAENTESNAKVIISSYPAENLQLLRTWQMAQFNCLPSDGGEPQWHVIQMRPSKWTPADQWLVENAEPAYSKRISQGGWGPWRLTAPLIQVYAHADYELALSKAAAAPAN